MDVKLVTELALSSPYKAIRLQRLSELSQDANIDHELIETLQKIEDVPLTITDYRDKERFLEDFLKITRTKQSTLTDRDYIISIRYLAGSLYINFEKFWGPTLRVINVFINESKNRNKLLEILLVHLEETTRIIYDAKLSDKTLESDDRPDNVLHRNFIFQIITRFASYVEKNSRMFMEQFFIFINNEMLVSPFYEKTTYDNLHDYGKAKIENHDEMDVDEEEPVVINDIHKKRHNGKWNKKMVKKQRYTSAGHMQKRKSKETYLTAVKVIHAFKSMNNVHRADEFKKLIMDFLCCRDDTVQKASFNCLIIYEMKSLKPYISNILRILDDKSARTELSMFSIDSDSSEQVLTEHRAELMPILLRILFGKMKGQIGKKSSGRDKADQRKTLVMRFISGCSTQEILYFFGILFNPIFEYTKLEYDKLETSIHHDLSLSKYPPLNRFHAMMATLTAYMKSVAHLKEETLKYIFKLINIMIYHVIRPLDMISETIELSFKAIDALKVLRRQLFNVLIEFFRSFQYYKFDQVEINFSFKYLIWPSCENFIDKNYSTPTPLLKLIETFAENTIYHQLLIKRNPVNTEKYLLRHLVDLYTSNKTTRPILKTVASILKAILNPEIISDDDEVDEEEQGKLDAVKQKPTDQLDIFLDQDAKIPEYNRGYYKLEANPPFNHEILLTFLPNILEKLKACCLEFLEKKEALYQLDKDELIILSTVSIYVKDPQQCLLGARLLLSAIDKIKKNDLILNTLRTCQALVHQAHPEIDHSIIPPVANTLAFQRNFDQRLELCALLKEVANSDSDLNETVQAIISMNATTGDVDSPDLVEMNEGFKMAFNILDQLDKDLINKSESVKYQLELLIHQVGFIMNNVEKYEFSIRENCATFYDKLSTKLRLISLDENTKFANHFINDLILEKFIKKGLRDTNDVIKHCYIGCLRSLAVNCHGINKTLEELNYFCSSNADTDLWLNLKHIQINKRANGMSNLLKSEKLSLVSAKTLSSYFLPIASGFLFTKSYKSFAGLIQNSIKLIGIICKSLNWKLYESTLNYYLGLLTSANTSYQKQNIKVITTILENFNYDLTSCPEAMEFEEENAKLEIRMKKRMGPAIREDEEQSITASPIAAIVPKGKKLNQSTARMVYNSVSKRILPHLNGCLHEMSRVEFEHDKQMANYLPEKDEIKRIPIAFAIVQLLNLLPGRYVLFREHLPTLFLKLSSFLKSKNENIRKSARDTLIKIMCFLGPAYIPDLLRVLKQNLDKGFQIHVLNYSIHSILDKMRLDYGCLDHSVDELLDLSLKEIFGKVAEDKEVAQILAKTPEAKKTKGYDTIMILCSCITAEKLEKLMEKVKELLKTANDPKKVNKLSVCLQRIFTGLSRNEQFPLLGLLDFIKTRIHDSIPSLKVRQVVEIGANEAPVNSKFVREDRFIIGKDMTRNRMVSKINERGNFHMVIDNCLRLFLLTLDKNKTLISENKDQMTMRLSEFVPILCKCLKATSPKCIMRSLKCIYFIAKIKNDIPSFRKKCNTIVKRLFIILNLYNGPGMVQGDNLEMIGMCIKTLTVLLLRCEYVRLNDTQIIALLSYIDQNLNDSTNSENSKQMTAYKSLHAIVRRRIDSPELQKIMLEVAKVLVRIDDEKIQTLTIKIWGIYLLDFNHEPAVLRSHLTHFLRQLDYEHIEGRRAILRMLKVVITRFPERILLNYYELMFHLLAQRVVNEESKDIRRQVGKIIAVLIQRLPNQQNYICNKFIFQWASHEQVSIKILGIKLVSIYLEATTELENDKLARILSLINGALISDRISDAENNDEDQNSDGDDPDIDEEHEYENEHEQKKPTKREKTRLAKPEDKLNYHALRLFKRIIINELCSVTENRYIDQLKPIWNCIAKQMLTYWYLPVVITSSELYLLFIRKTDLLTALNESSHLQEQNPSSNQYLAHNAKIMIRTLCDNFITLLDRVNESEKLLVYINEALITLGQVIANSETTIKFENQYKKAFENGKILDYLVDMEHQLLSSGFVREKLPYTITEARRKLDLMWLSTKIVMQARKEVALFRLKTTYRREFVLKWIASILQELGGKRATPYLILYSMIPIRELTDKGKNKASDKTSPITTLAEDLLKFIKSLVSDKFNQIYSKVQLFYTKKRVVRKKEEAILKIKDQSRGVKRKLKTRQDKQSKKKNQYSKGVLNKR